MEDSHPDSAPDKKELIERVTKTEFEGRPALLIEFGKRVNSGNKFFATYKNGVNTERIIVGGNKEDKTHYTVVNTGKTITNFTGITIPSPTSPDKEPYQYMIMTMENPIPESLTLVKSQF